MELFAQTQQKSRLGQILLDKRLVSQEQLSKAMEQQATTGERLGDILTQWNVVTQRHIESALRAQRNLRLVASLVTAMATPFITACGGGGGDASPTTQSSAGQPSAASAQSAPTAAVQSAAAADEQNPPVATVAGWVIKDSVCCAPVTNSTIAAATNVSTPNSTATTAPVVAPISTTSQTIPATLTAPNNLAAQALNATRVSLTWTDDSNGKAKYRVYRGNTPIDEVMGSSYTDYAASASTAYTYQVRAIDADNAANTSALSNVAAVTTPAVEMAVMGRCSAKRFA